MSKKSSKSYSFKQEITPEESERVAKEFFGAGYVPKAAASAETAEQSLSVHMRLMAKTSTTTKIKALSEIARTAGELIDGVKAGYFANFVEVAHKHLTHENPQVRAAIFGSMRAFVEQAGPEMKREIARLLGRFMAVVLYAKHDAEQAVRNAAGEVLHAVFPGTKVQVALERCGEEIKTFMAEQLDAAMKSDKPIKNEDEDSNALLIVMSFGVTGFLLANHPTPSSVQPIVVAFLQRGGSLRRCLPQDETSRNAFTAAAPKLRTAVVELLTQVVAARFPLSNRDTMLFWAVAAQGISDAQAQVAYAAWHFVLRWIEAMPREALGSLPDSFVGTLLAQIDNLSVSSAGVGVEGLLSSLLPFATVVSREEKHADIIDDISGTLVEKAKAFSARPSGSEFAATWAAVWECWDLHMFRKRARGLEEHSLELLAVTLAVVVEQIGAHADGKRLLAAMSRSVAPLAAKSILKNVRRLEDASGARPVLELLTNSSARFRAISHASQEGILLRFAVDIAAVWLQEPIASEGLKAEISHFANTLLDKLVALCEATTSEPPVCEPFESLGSLLSAARKSDAKLLSMTPDTCRDVVTKLSGHALFPVLVAPHLFTGANAASTDGAAEVLLSRVLYAGVEDVTSIDIKTLTVAVAGDTLRYERLKDLVLQVMPAPRFLDVTAEAFKSMFRQNAAALEGDSEALSKNVRAAIKSLVEVELPGSASMRNASTLQYDNENPSSSESSSGSSSDSSSESGDAESDTDSKSSRESLVVNNAHVLQEAIVGWMDILSDESFIRGVLGGEKARIVPFAQDLLAAALSISPLLSVEQFVALRFIRSRLTRPEEALNSETILSRAFARRNHLAVQPFKELLLALESFCHDDFGLDHADGDNVMSVFFDACVFSPDAHSHHLSGSSYLSTVASAFGRPLGVVTGQHVSAVAVRLLRGATCVDDDVGIHALAAGPQGLADALRLAQLAGIVAEGLSAFSDMTGEVVEAAVVGLVAALAVRRALNDNVVSSITNALNRFLAASHKEPFTAAADEDALVQCWARVAASLAQFGVLPTLGGVLRGSRLAVATRCVMSGAAAWYCALPRKEGGDHATAMQGLLVAGNCCEHRCIKIRPETISQIHQELCGGATHARATTLLMLLRASLLHHSITDDILMTQIKRCHRPETEVAGLALLAELMCAHNDNQSIFTDLCRLTTSAISRNYALCHLPTNGRLGQRAPTADPLPLDVLRPTILALTKVACGLAMHQKRDDVLRSTINLVVCDAVCEAMTRLRDASNAAIAPTGNASIADVATARTTTMASLVAFVARANDYLNTLQTKDIASVAASEQSTGVIGNALALVHAWVCGSTLAQLEAVGVPHILEVLAGVNMLAIVALADSPAAIPASVSAVRRRLLVKGVRIAQDPDNETTRMTTATSVRLAFFRRIHAGVSKTTKQKISLFTYLTAWVCTLRNQNTPMGALTLQDRSEVMQLLDLVIALLMQRTASGANSGRQEDALLFLTASQAAQSGETTLAFQPRCLGELAPAAQLASKRQGQEIMIILAKAAASVLTLALQSPLLPAVREWLGTIDVSIQSRVVAFVQEHISPVLIQTGLAGVLSHSPTGAFTFEVESGYTCMVGLASRTLVLSYTFDDVSAGVSIALPAAYPLVVSPDMVQPTQQSGVRQIAKWRTWCMKMSSTLFSGDIGSLWEVVTMFGGNMQKYFDGVEPCAICYCVFSPKRALPDMECPVCHNKCHSTCLHKWWASVGRSTCPYCRTPWVS